jgi:hypothetical protein
MSDSMLFDTSPLEGDGQSKKKGGRRKPKQDEPLPMLASQDDFDDRPPPLGFLLSLDSVPCNQCGAPMDLAEVVIINGIRQWRVQCGWWCMHSWLMPPIPGLLDAEEKKGRAFVLREGRFAGKTLDEVWDEGGEWYIRELATLAKSDRLAKAASEWLAKKIA